MRRVTVAPAPESAPGASTVSGSGMSIMTPWNCRAGATSAEGKIDLQYRAEAIKKNHTGLVIALEGND